jgi:Xaa-Pro aminopeptidase
MAATVQGNHDFSFNIARRKELVNQIKKVHPNQDGLIVLFAAFESEGRSFRQESSFYYLTGLTEPGAVLTIDLQGNSTLYMPNCGDVRSKWMFSEVALTPENLKKIGISAVKNLGSKCNGYQFHPFFPRQEYDSFLQELTQLVGAKKSIFTLAPNNPSEYIEQRLVLQRLEGFLPGLAQQVVDICPIIAQQRRIKDMREIDNMFVATEITMMAHEAAAQAIKAGALECEVQAALEYVFTAAGGQPSFPSIVATGKNSTVLHYQVNSATIELNDLVVVDIGAEFGHYCADLTRTYPASGKFTKRQKEVYDLVLETQEYIASIAKPGMWLNNGEHPDKSLNHLARAYLAKKGYDKYFLHGVGHYLGLDVHDVGDYKKPLEVGDVFTIEPGIYIAEEKIGVRIEDDYWVVKDGVVCLSESLPKKAEDIEKFMHEDNPKDFNEDEEDENDLQEFENDFSDQASA